MKKNPFISVIITAHAEGILIHRTLASVQRAISQLPSSYRPVEIVLHVDNPTQETTDYINTHKLSTLKDASIYTNSFGDLGSSRNFAIERAKGKYIATIDADDLMSLNWLKNSLDYLESQKEPTIAHSEVTVEFEGANSLVLKHGEIDYDTDTLLSVFANRWNSVIVAPKNILQKFTYTPNSPGFGYEDWNLNSRLIYAGVHNVLIPKTAIFVRRKKTNSEWARQVQSMAVLRANPLLGFENIRKIRDPFLKLPEQNANAPQHIILRSRFKSYIKSHPMAHKAARYVKKIIDRRKVISLPGETSRVSEWLRHEWKDLHKIEKQINPSQYLIDTVPVYDTMTEDHKITGSAYKLIVDSLRFNSYPYLIFTPWLTKGGADKYTIEYANTIARQTNKPVLVIATLPVESPWKNKLSDAVDFIDFGTITATLSQEIRHRLMEHIIENGDIEAIHIINSEFGYDFVQLHEKYIKSTNKKIVVTSFSQSVDLQSGRLYGYSHTHVPYIYDLATLITSDNRSVIDMWISEYGFNPTKLKVHKQPIDTTKITKRKEQAIHKPLRVLWAARIAPEKLPEIAIKVGNKLQGVIQLDMYGSSDPEYKNKLNTLPENISYKGSYDGFKSLPVDNYDVLLYTSLFDGMPNVLLEAAAAKLPIIASSVGGIPEFITNHNNGSLVTDILNPEAYIDSLNDFIKHSRGQKYAKESYDLIETSYSQAQYEQSITDMLKFINLK